MGVEFILKQLASEAYATSYYLSVICFFITTLLLVLNLNLTRKRSSKSKVPPSPPKFPFIGNLHQLGTLPHRSLRDLSHNYGPLMLLHLGQTPTMVVSSADVVREIIKTHDAVFSDRPLTTATKIFFYHGKDVAFAPYGEEWTHKKKICHLQLLNLKRVQSMEFIREEEVAELVCKIREACIGSSHGCSVNLTEMMFQTTTNILSRCVLGHKYDAPNGNSSFRDLIRKMMAQFVAFSVGDFFPSLGWIDFVTRLIPKMKAIFGELDAFFDEVIAQHKTRKRNEEEQQSADDRKDLVDILLQIQQDGNMLDFKLTQDDIKAILMDMFVGGSDTSATTMEWAMAELMKNPTKMEKVQEEVRRVVGHKSKVEEAHVKEMKYLECVVKETLRLHPAGPLLLPRETRSRVKLRGYEIPSRTSVIINAWAIQREPQVWERAEEFIPERFENCEIDFKGQDFQLIPFGTGRRGCPGISVGVAMVEYMLANILCWFDWKLPPTAQGMDMSEAYGLTLTKKLPLHLQPILPNGH